MPAQLTKTKAIELVNFIADKTNYEISSEGEGLYTKDEAIAFVNSDIYDPEVPLNVCFDTKQGDNWESASMSFDGDSWLVDDFSMGGHSANGQSIEEALVNFRLKHDSTCDYYPVELIVNP